MLRIQVDDVKKSEREYFKAEISKATEGKANVYACPSDKVIVEVTEPYFATEESIIAKDRAKKAIHKVIHDFRTYQFNQVN